MFEIAPSGASENGLEIQTRFLTILGCLWTPFGTLFSAFWASWESFGLPLAVFWQPLEALMPDTGGRHLFLGPPRTCRDSAEHLPKFSRELAEAPPRIRQESAENPTYEPQAKLSFTLRLLRMDCVLRQTLRQNRRE